jgi:hypothetical protein
MKVEITAYGAARIKFLQDNLEIQNPGTMGITDGMRRSILTGRLAEAFEAGWRARESLIPIAVRETPKLCACKPPESGPNWASASSANPICPIHGGWPQNAGSPAQRRF